MNALNIIGPGEVKERNIITAKEIAAMCDCLDVFMKYRALTGGDREISKRKYEAAESGLGKLKKVLKGMA